MTPIAREKTSRLRVLTRLGFWFTLLIGFLLPWAIMLGVDTWVHDVPLARAWRSLPAAPSLMTQQVSREPSSFNSIPLPVMRSC